MRLDQGGWDDPGGNFSGNWGPRGLERFSLLVRADGLLQEELLDKLLPLWL